MARPPKYSTERADAIVRAIRQGNTLATSARLGGIAYDTLNEWRKRFSEFSEAVTRAEAEAESLHVNAIVSAGVSGNWQASAWWLERRRTGDWRKPSDRLVVTDYRKEAEAIAAEIGKPELAEQIAREMQADVLLSQEAR